MDFDAYRALKAWNFSTLKHGIESMAHLRHRLDHPESDPDTTDRGKLRLYHAAILEPDRLLLDFKVPSREEENDPRLKRNRKEGKDAWAAHLAANPGDEGMEPGAWQALLLSKWNPGKTVISASDYSRALDIRDAVRRHPRASQLVAKGKGEHTIQWTHTDSETGEEMDCKGRIDFLADQPAIVDLKGIGTDARMVRRISTSNLYYAQQGMYAEGLAKAEGIVCPVYLLTYETTPPYDVAVWRIKDADLARGWETMRRVLAQVAKCKQSGRWPGRYEDEQVIKFPPWIDPDYDPESIEDGFEVVPNESEAA